VSRTRLDDEVPRRHRRRTELHLFRLVPRDSFVHRLWAGTKLLCLAMLSLTATLHPTWTTLVLVGFVIATGIALAQIPLRAAPRLPRWFFIGIALGGVLSVWSTAPPTVRVQGIMLSLGGLEDWARFLVLAVLLVTGAALIGWTTPAGEFAPALGRLFRPARHLRLPVDDWLVAIALGIRCFPILVDEMQTLLAVRRLRRHGPGRVGDRRSLRFTLGESAREVVDLLTAALVASLRRARDMSEAIEARGGLGAFSDSAARARGVDWCVVLVVASIVAIAFAFG